MGLAKGLISGVVAPKCCQPAPYEPPSRFAILVLGPDVKGLGIMVSGLG